MKKMKWPALILVLALAAGAAGCGKTPAGEGDKTSAAAGSETSGASASGSAAPGGDAAQVVYGPVYDEWSEMTDDALYEKAKAEGGVINVYTTSSKMLKEEEPFEKAFPGLDVVVTDLDQDEVLQKCKIEAETGNITGDVLEAKDVNGGVFFDYYEQGFCSAFYPKDICENIDTDLLKYGYPLYSSQPFWYYNTEAFPDGQPIHSWWELIEKKEDGSQKYRLFLKDISQESTYLALMASFIQHGDEMAKAYKDTYGKDLDYTYDASGFAFRVPEQNAGVEFMWRLSQMKMTLINDGDELVLAVNNSTAGEPVLALASGGKIVHQEESGYNIDWVKNLTPYTAMKNCEYLYVVTGCDNPAGARLFIRFITGGADGKSGGLKPFSKQGNWVVRNDVESDWNPISLEDCGAIDPDLGVINELFMDAQDMWAYWYEQNPNK